MSPIPRTTIEQWAVLRVVVEQQGFAQAAVALNRSQSSVSYAVARLQDGLGLKLLEIQGRRAVLTEVGRALLAEAIPLIDDLVLLEQRGRSVAGGHEARIHLLVDSLFPKKRLFDALEQLTGKHPFVQIDLEETVRQTAPDPVVAPFDLAVAPPGPGPRFGRRLTEVDMLAVARAGHPLLARSAPLSAETLARFLRVDILHSGGRKESDIETERRVWQVSTVEGAVSAVLQGLCYGWLPRHLIETYLIDGMLLPLNLAQGGVRQIPLDVVHADEERSGPATRALAGILLAN